MSSHKEGWLVATLDAIAQFRATKEPLKNVVRRISLQRKLGSRERAQMSDAVFAWSRLLHQSDAVVESLKQSGVSRPSHRQVDETLILDWIKGNKAQVAAVLPDWFVAKLTQAYGDQLNQLLESLGQRAGPTLAFDPRHLSAADLCAALDSVGVAYKKWPHFEDAICILAPKFRLESLPPQMQKRVWVMDPASQLVAQLAIPATGKKVLDCCAGGGGKTQFLLSRGARVTAMDISERRLEIAKTRCRGEAVHFVVGDATDAPFEPGSFEFILIDAPCTGTGTLRRAPDLLLRLSESEVPDYVTLQRQILKSMLRVLKKGGKLIYATCSILPEENHLQAKWAQEVLKLKLVNERQLLPSLDDSDGFFVAVFEKMGD